MARRGRPRGRALGPDPRAVLDARLALRAVPRRPAAEPTRAGRLHRARPDLRVQAGPGAGAQRVRHPGHPHRGSTGGPAHTHRAGHRDRARRDRGRTRAPGPADRAAGRQPWRGYARPGHPAAAVARPSHTRGRRPMTTPLPTGPAFSGQDLGMAAAGTSALLDGPLARAGTDLPARGALRRLAPPRPPPPAAEPRRALANPPTPGAAPAPLA